MKQHLQRVLTSSRERGATMFLVAIMIIIVLVAGAFAVDLSVVANRGQSLQNAVDSAALTGVQAYRASIGDDTVADATDEQAAIDAVEDALAQNGITGLAVNVEFPDQVGFTEVEVTITDDDPGTLLSGVTGASGSVERSATARFASCQADCSVEVEIPSPFRSVDADGSGDGYKPISVDHELYALNHNSSYGAIVCIDRNTANDPIIEGVCEGWSDVDKPAYSAGAYTQINPEMPHAAVAGTTIYWTAADSGGTNLYCFETSSATPCDTTLSLNNNARASHSTSSLEQKDRNRGGGTVEAGGNIFVFTDDHLVHCRIPETLDPCSNAYAGGANSFLRTDGFPDNEPTDGNHGSSIDRIVDEDAEKIYWTIHINTATPDADCSVANAVEPVGLVALQNTLGNRFAERDGENITRGTDASNPNSHWFIVPQGTDSSGNRLVSFRSATGPGEADDIYWIDSDSSNGADLDISDGTKPSDDDIYRIIHEGSTSRIYAVDYGRYWYDDGSDFETHSSPSSSRRNWVIQHPDCFTSNPGAPVPTSVSHEPGTWLQCWSYKANNQGPCAGFTPIAVHTDASRFSGRLFFHMTDGPNQTVDGVCSSGFDGAARGVNFEITCVDNDSGAYDAGLTSGLANFESAIAAETDSGPAAWGDPHYNDNSNRVFYPTAHDNSHVVCWDFSDGMCGVEQQYSSHGQIRDYGFFSEGDCVYGLGHNAYFYAFQADDITSECTGSTTRTTIDPCNCSGDWQWGTITFDVDLALFDEFHIQVVNSSGVQVYPEPTIDDPAPVHSLHDPDDGLTVDLNDIAIGNDPLNDFLEILVSVNAESDPWAQGLQTFQIEFARAPRLVE